MSVKKLEKKEEGTIKERYFLVRRSSEVLFIKTSKNSMWETNLATYKYSQSKHRAETFANTVNEILGTNYSVDDLIGIGPRTKKELFKINGNEEN